MAEDAVSAQEIANREHIGPDKTGDNIPAKRVAQYGFNGSSWQRTPTPFIDIAYDDIQFSNADSNGNYQTIEFKSNSTTVRTLTLSFDANNKATSITRS